MKKAAQLTFILTLFAATIFAQETASVRSIDFKNFTYPSIGPVTPFTMANGYSRNQGRCITEYRLKEVLYKDVTDDEEEEAIAVVNDLTSCGTRKPATRYFIYTVVDGRPRFLRRQSAEYDPRVPRVTDVRLSKESYTHPCPEGTTPSDMGCPDDGSAVIDAEPTSSEPLPEGAVFKYEVTGGTVQQTDDRAEWDTTGLRPGTYRLSVWIELGEARSNKRSAAFRVEMCRNCIAVCECPTLQVLPPTTPVAAGSVLTFSAQLAGGNQRGRLNYNWTVSGGTIAAGQGTPTIRVQTAPNMAGTVIAATVTVGGLNPACNCPATASGQAAELTSPKP